MIKSAFCVNVMNEKNATFGNYWGGGRARPAPIAATGLFVKFLTEYRKHSERERDIQDDEPPANFLVSAL